MRGSRAYKSSQVIDHPHSIISENDGLALAQIFRTDLEIDSNQIFWYPLGNSK